MNTIKMIEKSLPPLVFGVIGLYIFGDTATPNRMVSWIQFFSWFAILCNTFGLLIVALILYCRWLKSYSVRAKADRAMRQAKDKPGNPFKSLCFVNGVLLLVLGVAFLAGLIALMSRGGSSALLSFLLDASRLIGWDIIGSLVIMACTLVLVGLICVAVPLLSWAEKKMLSRKPHFQPQPQHDTWQDMRGGQQ